MKAFRLSKIWFIPVLFMVFALASLTSCQKDNDSAPAADSLAVTVYFNGNTVPDVGDNLMVVVYYEDVTALDPEQGGEPDVNVTLVLTQDMIDNGVTVNLDTINLDAPEIYVGAYVSLDDVGDPSTGDLIEFYENIDFIDALFNDVLPENIRGLSSVEIYLDQLLTYPSLEVTVNFTGETQPTAEDVLHIALFYYNLDGQPLNMIDPDDEVFRNLTPNDIGAGSVTLTLHNIYPWEDEVYIGAFVDTDGNQSPDPGELIEMYEDKNIFDVLDGSVAADNVVDETEITMNLNLTVPVL